MTKGQLAQSPIDADLLGLGQIVEALRQSGLNATYDKMRGLLGAEGVRTLMGAVRVGGKGVRYPAANLPIFGALVEAHERKRVTPETALAFLTDVLKPIGESAHSTDLVPAAQIGALGRSPILLPPEAQQAMNAHTEALNALAAEMAEANRLKRIEAPADPFLTLTQVRELLPTVGARWLNRRLPGVVICGRWCWRWSEVLGLMDRVESEGKGESN